MERRATKGVINSLGTHRFLLLEQWACLLNGFSGQWDFPVDGTFLDDVAAIVMCNGWENTVVGGLFSNDWSTSRPWTLLQERRAHSAVWISTIEVPS